MKSDDRGKGGRVAVHDGAVSEGRRLSVPRYGLGLLAGVWLVSANAENDYTPLILDNPTPQAFSEFGRVVASAGDVNGDGVPDALVGAPGQTVGDNSRQGRAFVFSGADASLLLILDHPAPRANALFGWDVAGTGDVNGDGKPDLLVGVVGDGQAFVFSGADGSLLFTLDNPMPQVDARFGESVASAGDVNGDEKPDLMIGAPGQTVGDNFAQGRAFVFSGADGSLLLTLDDPAPRAYIEFGGAVAGAGDVNGDGKSDLLAGAIYQKVDGNVGQGQAFVFSGADGSLLLTLNNPRPQADAWFGSSVASTGDVDGDGRPDLLVGARGQTVGDNSRQGQAFVFSGADGTLLYTLDNPTPQVEARFGSSVAAAGDVNGDGVSDFLVNAPYQTVNGNPGQGQAFVFNGADGSLLLTLDDPSPALSGLFGWSVAGAGDVNGDGIADLLAGSVGHDLGDNPDQGQAVLFISTPTTPTCFGVPATIVGTAGNDVLRGTPGNDVIVGLAGNDVIDGRGGDDLICGGEGDDRLRGSKGNDKLSGGEDNDILWGGAGDDLLEGNGGRDRASGGSGNDILRGGEGDDRLNVVDGAGGNDIADGDRCAADNRDTVQNCNL